jgi:dethiobiotin synthetase
MPKVLHVLGTDTDVGKTWVMTLLLKILRSKGLKVLPIKPVHSGWGGNETWGSDLSVHKEWLSGVSPEDLCAYRFERAMSPFGAAKLEGKSIDRHVLNENWNRWMNLDVDVLLVEGIGGVMCPLSDGFTYLDWISEHPEPCLLVSKVGLGSLNQALMSLYCLASNKMPMLGVILNEEQIFDSDDPISQGCESELNKMTPTHIWGTMKREQLDQNLATLSAALESFLRESSAS